MRDLLLYKQILIMSSNLAYNGMDNAVDKLVVDIPFAEDDSDQDEEDHEGDGGPQDAGPQGPQEDVAKHPDVQGHRVGRQYGDADVVLPHAE